MKIIKLSPLTKEEEGLRKFESFVDDIQDMVYRAELIHNNEATPKSLHEFEKQLKKRKQKLLSNYRIKQVL